jgi:hypothetical protein
MEGVSVVGPAATTCCVGHGTPGCDNASIQACVCAQDSFCCTTQWDGTCVSEVESFGCGSCAGDVVAVRARRIWVEAFVPRGYGRAAWVPLDPAFKTASVHPGLDIPQEMALDAQAFIDEYWEPSAPGVTLPRPETPVQLLANTITGYLATNHPGMTVADVQRTHAIVSQNLGALPASLPYTVRSRAAPFSEISAARRYQVRFRLYNGATTFIDYTGNLPQIAGRRVTISYVGATAGDQATIASHNGLLYTPPNLISIRPLLKIAGQTVATGAAAIGAGRTHNSDMYFLAPVNAQGLPQNVVPAVNNTIVAGELQAIGLAVQGTSSPLTAPANPGDTEGYIPQQRFADAIDYLGRALAADSAIASLFHSHVTLDVDDAIVKDDIKVMTDGSGNPTSWQWRGLTVDADRSVVGVWKVEAYESGCGGEGRQFLIIGGAEGSLYENRLWEDDYTQTAVSTMKILQLAKLGGITVYKRWNTLPLPANTLPSSTRSAIQSAIAAGHQVTFPASEITYFNWTGTGYIDMDPCNGAAGYIISGGQNGGSTVDSWTDILWANPFKTVDYVEGTVTLPPTDQPDPGALYAKLDTTPMHFEYQLRVHYTDGSFGGVSNRSHNSRSPSDLAPDLYVLTVGDQGPQHIRRLAVVEIKIADVVRTSGLPLSVSPTKTKNVDVTIKPETGTTYTFVVEETGSGNGSATVTTNATRATSGPITITGGTQTTPGSAGKLIVRAKLGSRKFGESKGFSVCAHPNAVPHGAHNPVNTATQAGMAIAVTYTSDSGTNGDLDQAYASEKVNNVSHTTGSFIGIAASFSNSGFLRASSTGLVDNHNGPKALFLNLFDTKGGAGILDAEQVHVFYDLRCGMVEAGAVVIPQSGYLIRRNMFGNPPPPNRVDLTVSKSGSSVTVSGFSSSAGPSGGSDTVTLRP